MWSARSFTVVVFFLLVGCSGYDDAATRQANVGSSNSSDQDVSGANDAPYAEVLFIPWKEPPVIVYRISRDNELQELVLGPLDAAVADSEPANYEILGRLVIRTKDRRENLTLFIPWGHFKIGDEYKIADFSKLAKSMSTVLDSLSQAISEPGK